MNAIVTKALEAIAKLPEEEQEAIARDVLSRIEADDRWDRLLADPRSPALLARLAREARAEIVNGDVVELDAVLKPKT